MNKMKRRAGWRLGALVGSRAFLLAAALGLVLAGGLLVSTRAGKFATTATALGPVPPAEAAKVAQKTEKLHGAQVNRQNEEDEAPLTTTVTPKTLSPEQA